MARSVSEWIGDNDDTRIPERIRQRVAKDCICNNCGLRVRYGGEIDHVIALANWQATEEQPHGNRESNLQLLCRTCHQAKTKDDVAEKARTYRKRKRYGPLKKPRSRGGFRGWRKMNGDLVWKKE